MHAADFFFLPFPTRVEAFACLFIRVMFTDLKDLPRVFIFLVSLLLTHGQDGQNKPAPKGKKAKARKAAAEKAAKESAEKAKASAAAPVAAASATAAKAP